MMGNPQSVTNGFAYNFCCLVLTLVAGLAGSQSVLAQVMSGEAKRGATATIFQDQADENSGSFHQICIGNLATTDSTRRAFATIDLPEIPAGAIITRVEFNLRQVRVRHMGGPKSATLEMHRVTQSWEEGVGGGHQAACGGGEDIAGVDWNNAPSTRNAPSASVALDTDDRLDISFDTDDGDANDGLIDDIQAWVEGEDNFGWRLKVAEEDTVDNARLMLLNDAVIHWTLDAEPDFEINPGLNDAWFNADTAGQGFFIIVFEDTGIIFMAWFTYDTELPPDDVQALLGAAEHRWLTAQGPYDGDTATLEVFQTEGGMFDMSEPAPTTGESIGTITIVWTDCENGVLTYNIDPPGVSGEIPITRIVPDNVALCEALGAE